MRLYVGAQDSHKVLLNELDNLPAGAPGRGGRQAAPDHRARSRLWSREIRPGAGARALPLTMLFFGMINWTHTWFGPAGAVDAGAAGGHGW